MTQEVLSSSSAYEHLLLSNRLLCVNTVHNIYIKRKENFLFKHPSVLCDHPTSSENTLVSNTGGLTSTKTFKFNSCNSYLVFARLESVPHMAKSC